MGWYKDDKANGNLILVDNFWKRNEDDDKYFTGWYKDDDKVGPLKDDVINGIYKNFKVEDVILPVIKTD